jgi:AraC family transcriptional activator FtrA
VPEAREGGRLSHLLDRMRQAPGQAGSVAGLAKAAGMSRRTFLRRFKSSTGATPGAWLMGVRVARARELLTSTDRPIEDVATAAGFGSAATLRHHFRRQMKVSPTDYRRQFGPAP